MDSHAEVSQIAIKPFQPYLNIKPTRIRNISFNHAKLRVLLDFSGGFSKKITKYEKRSVIDCRHKNIYSINFYKRSTVKTAQILLKLSNITNTQYICYERKIGNASIQLANNSFIQKGFDQILIFIDAGYNDLTLFVIRTPFRCNACYGPIKYQTRAILFTRSHIPCINVTSIIARIDKFIAKTPAQAY